MKAVALMSFLFFVSCATPYQKEGFGGGFSQELASKNTYEVSFRGNGYTGRQRVERFLKRRCAEITRENGFTHYIVSANSETGEEKPLNKVVIKLTNNPPENVIAYEAELILKNTAD